MATAPHNHIILFDGVCNLCNKSVQFVIKKDKQAKFKFAALQSEAGRQLLKEYNRSQNNFTTIIYIRNNKIYTRSSAALHILKDLGGIWQLCYPFIVIPPFIRNPVYNIIAQNRYKLFGKQDSCMIPTPDLKNRFLE